MVIKNEYIPPQVNSLIDQARDMVKDIGAKRVLSSSVIASRTLGVVAVAALAGAAVAYFWDPVSGADRRSQLKKKGQDLGTKTADAVKEKFNQASTAFSSAKEKTEDSLRSDTSAVH